MRDEEEDGNVWMGIGVGYENWGWRFGLAIGVEVEGGVEGA